MPARSHASDDNTERPRCQADAGRDLAARKTLASQRNDLTLALTSASPIVGNMPQLDPASASQAGEQDRHVAFGERDLAGDVRCLQAVRVQRGDTVNPGMRIVDRAAPADAVGPLVGKRPATALARDPPRQLGLPGALPVTFCLVGVNPAGDRRSRHAELGGDLTKRYVLGTPRASTSDQVITRGHERASL